MTDSVVGIRAHTPGPWKVDPRYPSEVQTLDDRSISSCWHSQCEGQDITLIGILPCSLEESAANACLMAAAPDLLEALKSMRRLAAVHMKARGFSAEDIEQSFPQTDAALAKAEGRS